MKKVVKVFIVLLCLFSILMMYTGYQIYSFANKEVKKSDAIMVLGCRVKGEEPSLSLERRMETALALYNNGYGEKIILSGGKGKGEDISEAEAMRRFFIKKGVDSNNLILEDKSTSTYENFKYSKVLMGKSNIKSLVVVSNGYHLRRAASIASKFNINASYKGFILSDHIFIELKGILREIIATYKYVLIGK
ncbi:YdcF family protein [Clostridium cylindrosporum]|uniref:DUF218 domain-containing protein n=1 Tax=Clostridium cylindrosporum DSM 605 TaxID=1121307 RepID=A0A0J8FZW0_CLOCY|nr:YdcF family protein [Clostridium cylindrosporum]KMT21091.1 hypothetical protein CLCY_1c03250 [Clostridium cylindrosporum DSM 605]